MWPNPGGLEEEREEPGEAAKSEFRCNSYCCWSNASVDSLSSLGQVFNSQHTHGGLTTNGNSIPRRIWCSLLAARRTACMWYIDIHEGNTPTYVHTNKGGGVGTVKGSGVDL